VVEQNNASFAGLLVDESPDALLALSLDGRVLSWNRGAEAIFGYSCDEALGRMLDELIVPDDQRAQARAALSDVAAVGSTVLQAVRRRRDGILLHVDISMRHVCLPGTEPFIAVSEKDITQLHLLRADRAMESRFRGPPELGMVTVEPARLKQILYTYLSNAIKFTAEEGSVTVRVTAQGLDLFRLDV
jgi:PAS domain S-box-containing protein